MKVYFYVIDPKLRNYIMNETKSRRLQNTDHIFHFARFLTLISLSYYRFNGMSSDHDKLFSVSVLLC